MNKNTSPFKFLNVSLFTRSVIFLVSIEIFAIDFAHATLVLPAVQIRVGFRSGNLLPNKTFPTIDALCKADAVYDPPGMAVSYNWVYKGYVEAEPLYGAPRWYCAAMLEPAPGVNLPPEGPIYRADVREVVIYACEEPMQLSGFTCILQPKKSGNACPTPSTPHPIDIGNGNKFLREAIYRGPGPFPLNFSLYYNSSAAHTSLLTSHPYNRGSGTVDNATWFNPNDPVADPHLVSEAVDIPVPGVGWMHSYQRNVSAIRGGAYTMLTRADGKVSTFGSPDPTEKGTLTSTVSAAGKTGWEYRAENGEIEYYNQNGLLSAIVNPAGLRQTLAYDGAGHVVSVTDHVGRALQISYDSLGRPDSLTDPVGGVYRFSYDGKVLASIEYPDHRSRTFLYETTTFPTALTGIIDENGKRYITYEYDASGRGTLEYMAGGVERYQVNYAIDDMSSTVIDPFGTARTVNFQKINGVAFVGSQNQPAGAGCSASTSYANYDANGNRTYERDFNGAVTTFTYDTSRNLETSRSVNDASATYTTTTRWHPTLRLPVTIAEPKRITTFTYDSGANLLSRSEQATLDNTGALAFSASTSGPARVRTFAYDGNGQLIREGGPRAENVTTYTYSAAGNLATITDALGHVTSLDDYDGNGRVGRMTAANGQVTTFAYSPRGWLTSETTGTQTTRYDYDGTGQLISITLPDNSTVQYSYDDAHRLTDLSDSLGNSIHYTLDAMGNRTGEHTRDPAGTLSRQASRQYDALGRLQQLTGGAQ